MALTAVQLQECVASSLQDVSGTAHFLAHQPFHCAMYVPVTGGGLPTKVAAGQPGGSYGFRFFATTKTGAEARIPVGTHACNLHASGVILRNPLVTRTQASCFRAERSTISHYGMLSTPPADVARCFCRTCQDRCPLDTGSSSSMAAALAGQYAFCLLCADGLMMMPNAGIFASACCCCAGARGMC